MTTDREALFHDLDNGIWVTLRAIADTYEEEGNVRMAEAYRWIAETRRFPMRVSVRGKQVWDWSVVSPTSPPRCVPSDWPQHWLPSSVIANRIDFYQPTLSQTYAALAAAYKPVRRRKKKAAV